MAKVKSLEEAAERYAESALISAIRLRRYWLSQGNSEKAAVEKAMKQASGMMASSGIPLERLIELFNELAEASGAFSNFLTYILKKQKSPAQKHARKSRPKKGQGVRDDTYRNSGGVK